MCVRRGKKSDSCVYYIAKNRRRFKYILCTLQLQGRKEYCVTEANSMSLSVMAIRRARKAISKPATNNVRKSTNNVRKYVRTTGYVPYVRTLVRMIRPAMLESGLGSRLTGWLAGWLYSCLLVIRFS